MRGRRQRDIGYRVWEGGGSLPFCLAPTIDPHRMTHGGDRSPIKRQIYAYCFSGRRGEDAQRLRAPRARREKVQEHGRPVLHKRWLKAWSQRAQQRSFTSQDPEIQAKVVEDVKRRAGRCIRGRPGPTGRNPVGAVPLFLLYWGRLRLREPSPTRDRHCSSDLLADARFLAWLRDAESTH
jgi:hypothetical protein